ncbi:MAG: SH3 domain-containing protein [Verrucomicrobia bacterium]|nr:MAG: SH3 domain-containing protein [Verrucomicrobiota bacterium]
MRRNLMWITIGVLGWASVALAERMSVQVQDGQVRATPSFLGAVVAKLPYGSAVEAQSEQNGWMQVQTASGQQGWMSVASLTKKKIVMTAGAGGASGASSDELALAGKGFNSDVEKEFKKQNPNMNFAAVDRMAKIKITPQEMQKFLAAGSVKPPTGGAK